MLAFLRSLPFIRDLSKNDLLYSCSQATDNTFANKLMENLLGKCENFAKPSPKPDPGAHFAVVHYAATVSYNVTGWLEKNKDPLNDTVVELFKNGTNALLVKIFEDHPGQPLEAKKVRLQSRSALPDALDQCPF